MAAIDHEAKLVEEYRGLEAANARLKELIREREVDLAETLVERNRLAGELKVQQLEIARLTEELKACQQSAYPQLLFSDDFEQHPEEGIGRYAIDDVQHGLNPTAPPFKLGRTLSAWLRWDGGLNQAGKCKAELGPRGQEAVERYMRLEFRKVYRAGLTFILPEDWRRDSSKCSILSFHGTEDPEELGIGRNANIGLHVLNDRVDLWRCWSATRTQTGNENRTIATIINPYVLGREYRLVFDVCFDWLPKDGGGIGYTKIWLNGEPILDEVGPNAYNDATGPYFKFGAYVANWSRPDRTETRPVPAEHTVHFKALRFGTEANPIDQFLRP